MLRKEILTVAVGMMMAVTMGSDGGDVVVVIPEIIGFPTLAM
ncbi:MULTISPECIES: hypothetical protein [unclassified Paenibacillus]